MTTKLNVLDELRKIGAVREPGASAPVAADPAPPTEEDTLAAEELGLPPDEAEDSDAIVDKLTELAKVLDAGARSMSSAAKICRELIAITGGPAAADDDENEDEEEEDLPPPPRKLRGRTENRSMLDEENLIPSAIAPIAPGDVDAMRERIRRQVRGDDLSAADRARVDGLREEDLPDEPGPRLEMPSNTLALPDLTPSLPKEI